MAFQKGQGGRPRGALNKATRDAQEFCRRVVDDPMYQARLRRRAMHGTLAPAIECMLWYYAKGKPKDRVEIDRGLTPTNVRIVHEHYPAAPTAPPDQSRAS